MQRSYKIFIQLKDLLVSFFLLIILPEYEEENSGTTVPILILINNGELVESGTDYHMT